MSLVIAIGLISKLLAVTMAFQALEIILLTKNSTFCAVWSLENLLPDLEMGLPLSRSTIEKIFSIESLRLISLLQMSLAVVGIFINHPIVFLLLLFTHLLICIRFRGNLNGGSDMMTVVVLTGLLISLFATTELWQKLGMIYISIHLIFSYFKAGYKKILEIEWRTGKALSIFLNQSIFPDVKMFSAWLKSAPLVALGISWLILLFELSSPLVLVNPSWVYIYAGAAIVFHFINYLTFGLNRFFWMWLSAWPAVFYSVNLLANKA
ncbi:HTTM domain-containing protein [Bdellovibrio reynosensis]|uniref:HTTM-like domain-containing protein n=1 Tax=Bdellovibrio reynosensis TaxID=2835041 RepID=A0ABY4C843_9BACT|nr:hypothetical protein [Bdellovibrio reynosensis]UOF00644.1 hypothetical protein MNR06_13150 [Bdellovibrio reynosensis]